MAMLGSSISVQKKMTPLSFIEAKHDGCVNESGTSDSQDEA
jgi:hypothetical protein